eukprot:PLAT12742.2.p1 GENE.PLAT12742.2~~PLAT12742.2.p1  ORF type:complete len:657 (-),score=234.74 PLAT12742.2:569-2539(-)
MSVSPEGSEEDVHGGSAVELELKEEGDIDKDVDDDEDSGVPTRSLLRSVRLHETTNTLALLRFGAYLFFLIVYCVILLRVRRVQYAWQLQNGLSTQFLETEFPTTVNSDGSFDGVPFKKNFWDIGTHVEFWQWLTGPAQGMLTDGTWYNGEPREGAAKNKLYLVNEALLGAVSLRQVRVKAGDCGGALDELAAQQSVCFPPWSPDTEQKSTWKLSDDLKLKWVDDLWLLRGSDGRLYSTGGYSLSLPTDAPNKTIALLAQLKSLRYTDLATRAVSMRVPVFNPVTRTALLLYFTVEFSATGRISSRRDVVQMPLLYMDSGEEWRVVLEVIFVLQLLLYVVAEVRQARNSPSLRQHLSNLWNAMDAIALALYIVVVVLYIIIWVRNASVDLTQLDDGAVKTLEENAMLMVVLGNFAAFNIVFGFLRAWKYVRAVQSLTFLWETLSSGFSELLVMVGAIGFLVTAFALGGVTLFSVRNPSFRNLNTAYTTLFRALLGDFDYEQLLEKALEPSRAALYFICYVFILYFTLVNMFIALVSDHYQRVSTRARLVEETEQGSPLLVTTMWDRIQWLRVEVIRDLKLAGRCQLLRVLRKHLRVLQRGGGSTISNDYHAARAQVEAIFLRASDAAHDSVSCACACACARARPPVARSRTRARLT